MRRYAADDPGLDVPTTAEPLSSPLQTDGVIKVKSAYPVAETIARIKRDIVAKGIKFFDEIDQAKLGADVGVKLRPSNASDLRQPPGSAFSFSRRTRTPDSIGRCGSW